MAEQNEQRHPANAVFLLLEDRQFRFSVVRPGLEKEKQRLGRLVTGKHQVRGFRHISLAPVSMLIPVIADEANLSAELARMLLEHWFESQSALKDTVSGKLTELGYAPKAEIFDDSGEVAWKTMHQDHAHQQFEGEFLPDEDANAVMLMSLLLGWFGTDEEEEPEAAAEPPAKPAPKAEQPEPKSKPKPKPEPKKADTKPAAKKAATKPKPKAAAPASEEKPKTKPAAKKETPKAKPEAKKTASKAKPTAKKAADTAKSKPAAKKAAPKTKPPTAKKGEAKSKPGGAKKA